MKFRLFGKEAEQFRQEDDLLRKNVEAQHFKIWSRRYLEDLHWSISHKNVTLRDLKFLRTLELKLKSFCVSPFFFLEVTDSPSLSVGSDFTAARLEMSWRDMSTPWKALLGSTCCWSVFFTQKLTDGTFEAFSEGRCFFIIETQLPVSFRGRLGWVWEPWSRWGNVLTDSETGLGGPVSPSGGYFPTGGTVRPWTTSLFAEGSVFFFKSQIWLVKGT